VPTSSELAKSFEYSDLRKTQQSLGGMNEEIIYAPLRAEADFPLQLAETPGLA